MATLEDPSPEGCQPKFEPLSFEVIQDASKRRGDILVDSHGYSYTVKYSDKSGINWHCTKRGTVCTYPMYKILIKMIFAMYFSSLDMSLSFEFHK